MSASPDEADDGATLAGLRQSIREHGAGSEDAAVTRLLRSLELTGGARHRAVAVASALGRGRARAARRAAVPGRVPAGIRALEPGGHRAHVHRRGAAAHSGRRDRRSADRRATCQRRLVGAFRQIGVAVRQCLDLGPDADRRNPGTRSRDQERRRGWVRKLTRKAGEPVVRLAVRRAMRIIGGEFVVGRTIEEALKRSAREAQLALCSFDMLGEGARTLAMPSAISSPTSTRSTSSAPRPAAERRNEASSISIKLSALEPRYSLTAASAVLRRLVPKRAGARAARGQGSVFSSPSMPRRRIAWICPWT
jgi:RHH-type transcriptional regulator, proline utilization regulon repressor / proline dehydrogenase / delta 1-pyrroline-5-carboxylate dehydrogenase